MNKNKLCATVVSLPSALMLTSCAHQVVRTDSVDACYASNSDGPGCYKHIPVGLVYSLPKGQVLLAASRKPITAADVAKAQADVASAQQAVADATTKLSAAQKTQAKNTVPGESDSQKADDQAAVDAAKATLSSGQAALAAAQLKLTDVKSGAPKTEADIKEAQDTASALQKKVTDADTRLAKAEKAGNPSDIKLAQQTLEETQKALERAQQHAADVEATRDGKYVETFTLTPQSIIPDETRRFVANLDHASSRDDTLKLSVVNGLLTTSNSQSTDQTANIIASLASAAVGLTTFIGAGIPVIPSDLKAAAKPIEGAKQPEEPPHPSTCEYVYAKSFDPTNAQEVDAINQELQDQELQAHFTLTTSFAPHAPALAKHSLPQATATNINGLVYRTAAGAGVVMQPVLQATKLKNCPLQSLPQAQALQVFVPDTNDEFIVPAEAGAMTASNFQYSFSSGMLTDYAVTRPSEVAAVASIPVDIVNKIMTIPTSILKLRLDYSTAETTLASQQASLITAQGSQQVALINAKLALDAAEANLATADVNDATAKYKALTSLEQAKQGLSDAITAAAKASAAATQSATK